MASSRTLAEKYRPRNFDEVFGQSVPVRYLRAIVGRRPRSVIISGPFGSGKTTLARIYAKAALCERLTKTGNPCDDCDFCTRFDSKTLYDYIEVDCALTSGIEKIRELAEVLRLPPMWAKRRVVVLDEAQGLSHSAKQALLKSIEDMVDSSIVVLITTDAKSLPDTLRSRLMPLEVRTLDTDLSVLLLERVCAREGIKYERKALELIAIFARGHPRDMLTALEQVEMFGDANEDHVRLALDQGDADAVSRYFTAALAGDVAQLVQVWQNWLLGPDEKLRVIQEFLIFLEYREILGAGVTVRPDFLLIPADKRRQLAQSLRSCPERLGMSESAFWEQIKSIWRYGSYSNTEAQAQLSALIFIHLLHGSPPTGATALPKEAQLDAPTIKRRPPPRPRASHRIRRLRSLGDQQEPKRNAVPLLNRPDHLAMEQVRALWERASVLVQEHHLMFNVRVELNWAEMGITDAATASRRLSDLVQQLRARMRRRQTAFHWIYVHEHSEEAGFQSQFVAHVGSDHARDMVAFFRKRAAELTGRALPARAVVAEIDDLVDKRVGRARGRARRAILERAAATEQARIARHWDSVRWLCRGLDPDLYAADEMGVRRRLIDLLGIPVERRRAAGVVSGDRYQSSRSMRDEVFAEADANKMAYLSAFRDEAWSWLDRGWEVREYANRLKEDTRRRRSKQEVLGLSVELGPEKVNEEYARLRESWPADPHKRDRLWTGWWEKGRQLD